MRRAKRLWRGLPDGQAVGEVGRERVDADAVLSHRVALPDRDGLVVQGLEVDGDAVRGADLVLAAVAAADGAGVVELGVPPLAQHGGAILRSRRSTVRFSSLPLASGASSSA